MTGRRIVDLIALINVSSSIAQKHFLIRSQQLNVYTTSSSVFKSFRPRPSVVSTRTARASTAAAEAPLEEGIEQDHFYTPGASTTVDPEPKHDLPVTQRKASQYPLPDGTIPPSNTPLSGNIYGLHQKTTHSRPSPEEAKRLQHASESSIPELTADPPAEDATQGTGNDIFYLRQARVSSVLSNLPRKKIPKRTEGEQVSTGSGSLNTDVFYETPGQQDPKIPEQVAIPEQQDEGLNSELFHSRKAKTILSQSTQTPKDLKPTASNDKPPTSYQTNVQKDNTKTSTSNLKATDQETAELASELSKDAAEHTPIEQQASSSQMCENLFYFHHPSHHTQLTLPPSPPARLPNDRLPRPRLPPQPHLPLRRSRNRHGLGSRH